MAAPRPPKFPIELTDDHRAALERIRVKLGARSAADAIRKLIEENDPLRPVQYATRYPPDALLSAKPLSGIAGRSNPKASVKIKGVK